MPALPKENSFTPPPAGPHPAICYSVVDKGTQPSFYEGKPPKHQISITWELFCDEVRSDGRRFSISRTYAWTMHKMAALRCDLEAWRGRPFEKSDFGEGGFEIKRIIGTPCLVNVKHEEKPDGIKATVDSVLKLPKSMVAAVGKLQNDPLYLWLSQDEFVQSEFDRLSDKMKEVIRRAPEYRAATTGEEVVTQDFDRGHDPDDDIPF